MSAAVEKKFRCIGRKCGDEIREEGRAIRYVEAQCKEMCATDASLCGKCIDLQTKYMMGANKGKYHGIMGEPLLPKSHIRGSAWNIETRKKEDAKLRKIASETEEAVEEVGATATAAAASSKVALTAANSAAAKAETAAKKTKEKEAAKAAKEAAKAAKAAAKEAEKAAADAEKAKKKATKEAAGDMKELLTALSGAANAYIGAPTRKRRATAGRKVAARRATIRKGRKSSSSNRSRTARRRASSNRRRTASGRSSSGTGNPFKAGAAFPPSPPMMYRRISRTATPSSGYVPRNLSGGPAAISYRNISPNERPAAERTAIQDKVLQSMLEAQMRGY
jgi:hypothetical protein